MFWSSVHVFGREILLTGGGARACLSVPDLNALDDADKEGAGRTVPRHRYAVGGSGDDGGRVKSVERYDEGADEWTEVSVLKAVRWALGCAVLDGHIYVAGGYGKLLHILYYSAHLGAIP